jgi:hypothetical protein
MVLISNTKFIILKIFSSVQFNFGSFDKALINIFIDCKIGDKGQQQLGRTIVSFPFTRISS